MKKSFFILPLILFAVSCAEKSYYIDGNSSQIVINGQMAYLRDITSSSPQTVDSCEVLHGHFQMSGPLDSVLFTTLFLGDGHIIPVILENGNIKINIENTSVKVSGTPLNDRLYDFLSQRDSVLYLINELYNSRSYMLLQGMSLFDAEYSIRKKERELEKVLDELENRFVKDNYDNELGTFWFMEICRRNELSHGFPVITPQIRHLYEKAPKKFRRSHDVEKYIKVSCSY